MVIVKSAESLANRTQVEYEEGWRKIVPHIPFLTFRSDWQVRVIPPFAFTTARFQVLLPSGTLKSVYLDANHNTGSWHRDEYGRPIPYWEVYPYRGDVGRCDMTDTLMLMEMIQDESEGEESEPST